MSGNGHLLRLVLLRSVPGSKHGGYAPGSTGGDEAALAQAATLAAEKRHAEPKTEDVIPYLDLVTS